MKTKNQIVKDWLPRYTGTELDEFGDYIILVNFSHYVRLFAKWHKVPIKGEDRSMISATSGKITIINFGMGSPNAGTIIDLLTAIKPKGCIFLGKCGGVKTKSNKVGDLILPIAAIRGEGTSNDYLPAEVPALPAFAMQKVISASIRDHDRDYWTGTVYTTNKRVWEHRKDFKKYLKSLRPIAVDMETATIFIAAFKNYIPTGALLLVSDMPMIPEGVKTEKSDKQVTKHFAETHLKIGIDALTKLSNKDQTVRHLKF